MKDTNNSKYTFIYGKSSQVSDSDVLIEDNNVDINKCFSGENVIVYPGCRILGSSSFIGKGAIIGSEAPVTIENCQIGPGVQLKGGYFKDSVFLKNASMGSGAHVREGTILEEGASGAHTVGLKQTILFPYVTLGSLVNFCDCFMAGGTDRKNHSEVGSSYIHFNFTPNQDKATASLIGDVPQGVMLNQPPIFLGGQGGLVGPTRLAYGTVIAAGSIYRKDELTPERLLAASIGRGIRTSYVQGLYQSIGRIVTNNILYIANLISLREWYRHVRYEFIGEDFPAALHEGLLDKVDMALKERIKRFQLFTEKMPESIRLYEEIAGEKASIKLIRQKKELFEKCPQLLEQLTSERVEKGGDEKQRNRFLEIINKEIQVHGKDYLAVIKGLSEASQKIGTSWLLGIVDNFYDQALSVLSTFKS